MAVLGLQGVRGGLLPMVIHRDEAMAECLASNNPSGSTVAIHWRRKRS